MALTGWPNTVDDNGDGQSGTILDAALFDAMEAALEAYLVDPGNPTITPADLIAEVEAARGSKNLLDDRLDVSLNEDGTLKTSAMQTALAGFRNLSLLNFLGNDQFRMWPNGDTSSPTYWLLTGTGATIQRTGSGLADTNRKHGPFAARTTAGALAEAVLTQALITTADFPVATLRSRYFALGCRAKTTTASGARLIMTDGGTSVVSTGHTGSGVSGPEADGWEWLSCVLQVGASATELSALLVTSTNATVYWSGATLVMSDLAPVDWVPAMTVQHRFTDYVAGNAAVGVKRYWTIDERMIVTGVTAFSLTAPTVSSLVVDVESWDGAAFTTMLAGGSLAIAATTQTNTVSPLGGTFARRCLMPQSGTTISANTVIRWEIATDDGGNTAADVTISIIAEAYRRPLDQLRVV